LGILSFCLFLGFVHFIDRTREAGLPWEHPQLPRKG
jgi:hypothetical protein